MTASRQPKIIITGTGRAGTTFLMRLLTELGLDTGYTPENWQRDYFQHSQAGLEHALDLEDPAAPRIIKNPALCTTLPSVLARGQVTIEFALVPIRRLEDATLSRVRVGGRGRTPGGLQGTADPAGQQAVLAENFHRLVETLAAHDIPHTFLHFPRLAQDAGYTYDKLRPILGGISRTHFESCFARVARPDLIHQFSATGPADAGEPDRTFTTNQRNRRLRRRLLRTASLLFMGALGWTAAQSTRVTAPSTAIISPSAGRSGPDRPGPAGLRSHDFPSRLTDSFRERPPRPQFAALWFAPGDRPRPPRHDGPRNLPPRVYFSTVTGAPLPSAAPEFVGFMR